jgi:hypothetical protein
MTNRELGRNRWIHGHRSGSTIFNGNLDTDGYVCVQDPTDDSQVGATYMYVCTRTYSFEVM